MIANKTLRIAKKAMSLMLLLFIFPIVIAQPFQTQSSADIISNSFSVVIPSEQTYKINSNIQIVASVFNATGILLGPSNSVSCRTQLIDQNNNLIVDKEMVFSQDQYIISLDSSILSKQVRHEYKVFCNTSSQGGFRTGEFIVSESGLPKNIEQVFFIVLLVLAILLFIIALNFQDPNFAFASGSLFAVIGIYLFRFGYSGIQNFLSDSMAIIIVGVGCYILFRTSVEYLEEAEN